MMRCLIRTLCFAIPLGLAVGPELVQAQNATVTVIMVDHLGNAVTPFSGTEIPGLTSSYAGRPGFDARTGGAFADQDMRNFSATYAGGPTDTFSINEGWAEVHNQSYTPAVTEDGEWLRVATDGVGSQNNNVAWPVQNTDSWNSLTLNFDIRISEGNPDSNDKADGFGFKWINSANHGTEGAFYTAGEEPNLDASIGIGFDIWDNGGATNDIGASGASATTSVSLHYGSWIQTVNLMDPDNEAGVEMAFPLETGQPINVTAIITIPEPSTLFMAGLPGAMLLGWCRRRRRA